MLLRAFNKEIPELADNVYALIINKISSAKNQNNGNNHSISNADEIRKYKDLLDSGVINQQEFDKKKKELLGV